MAKKLELPLADDVDRNLKITFKVLAFFWMHHMQS